MVAHPLVNTFVMARKNDEVALQGEFVGHVLVETLAVGRGENHLVVVALSLQGADATVDRLALHDHSGRAAVRIVVHAAPLVERVVAQVVQAYFGQSLLLGTGQNRLVDEALEHLRQYGDNIYSHKYCFIFSMLRSPMLRPKS